MSNISYFDRFLNNVHLCLPLSVRCLLCACITITAPLHWIIIIVASVCCRYMTKLVRMYWTLLSVCHSYCLIDCLWNYCKSWKYINCLTISMYTMTFINPCNDFSKKQHNHSSYQLQEFSKFIQTIAGKSVWIFYLSHLKSEFYSSNISMYLMNMWQKWINVRGDA